MRRNRRNEPEHVRQARRKVRSKKWFFRHFSIYLVISIFFFCMNMLDSPHDPWFLYPVISWGTLIGIQYLWTFGLPFTKAGTREWEERELARELAKSAPGYQDPQDYQEEAPPVQRLASSGVNIDDHLELQEVSKEKVAEPIYRNDDLV
ncbi:MAG: 2TM domain-containing protein [Lewinella sp.]|jgi:hypothetical protein|uniref:2TM domain-containing protein n=1 Tax=Lewinella sp. TaxID=2004506 RepID=UPI003D6B3D28